jgi:hypothetical protein
MNKIGWDWQDKLVVWACLLAFGAWLFIIICDI